MDIDWKPIDEALDAGRRVVGIKLYWNQAKCGLEEAKKIVYARAEERTGEIVPSKVDELQLDKSKYEWQRCNSGLVAWVDGVTLLMRGNDLKAVYQTHVTHAGVRIWMELSHDRSISKDPAERDKVAEELIAVLRSLAKEMGDETQQGDDG